jgi:hypothetical protein
MMTSRQIKWGDRELCLKGELPAMVTEQRESHVVVRLVNSGEADWETAAADLRTFLSRESVGDGQTKVELVKLETRKGVLGEIGYHVVDGTAEALVAILISAVRSWVRHWRKTRGNERTVEIVRTEGSTSTTTTIGGAARSGPPEADGDQPTDAPEEA